MDSGISKVKVRRFWTTQSKKGRTSALDCRAAEELTQRLAAVPKREICGVG